MVTGEAIPWGNVLLTLFVAQSLVFVVLGALQISLYVSGAIVSRLEAATGKAYTGPVSAVRRACYPNP